MKEIKIINDVVKKIAKKLNLKEQIYLEKSGAVKQEQILSDLIDVWSLFSSFLERLKQNETNVIINEVVLSLEDAIGKNPIFKETYNIAKEIKDKYILFSTNLKEVVKKLDILINKLDDLFEEYTEEEEEEY